MGEDALGNVARALVVKVTDIDVKESPKVVQARTTQVLEAGAVVFETRHRTRRLASGRR